MGVDIPAQVLDWLMEGPEWVRHRTMVDLGSEPEDDESWKRAMQDPLLLSLVEKTTIWPWPRISSHKSAGHPLHGLVFLADLGLRAEDGAVRPLLDRILAQACEEGPFQLIMNVPKAFGGTGRDGLAWSLCDAPSLTYALNRMGLGEDPRVRKAALHMASLARENGFPCASSKELGRFRGPGRKEDPCPYADLVMLKLLAEAGLSAGPEARAGVECLLSLWQGSRERHPYMFYMGTDFRKLKTPFVWYDILHVAEVLTRFEMARDDERLKDMLSVIWAKRDAEGKFTAESIWTDWRRWEFGQKKEPSRWLTLCVYRIMARARWIP